MQIDKVALEPPSQLRTWMTMRPKKPRAFHVPVAVGSAIRHQGIINLTVALILPR